MRNFAVLLLAAWVLVAPAPRAAAGDAEDISAVISAQIEAFLSGDLERAFSFAAPNIKARFGTPGRFARMVAEGYPMVWRPASVAFLDRIDTGRGIIQRVLLQDAAGRYFVARYLMVRTPQGWQIAGVDVERAAEAAA